MDTVKKATQGGRRKEKKPFEGLICASQGITLFGENKQA